MVFGEAKFCGISFELSELDVDRAWNVTLGKRLFASHIDYDGCSIIECSFGVLDSYPWKIGFGKRYVACLGDKWGRWQRFKWGWRWNQSIAS